MPSVLRRMCATLELMGYSFADARGSRDIHKGMFVAMGAGTEDHGICHAHNGWVSGGMSVATGHGEKKCDRDAG